MDRRLGEPLPHQLSNPTRAHPCAINLWQQKHAIPLHYAVLSSVSRCYPPHKGRLLTRYSPVRHWSGTEVPSPFDLNVLCTPPAFILSQDQTLKQIVYHPLQRFDSFELFILAFFTFLELCSLWFWQIFVFALAFLILLCTSIFCCSIVKFQSLVLRELGYYITSFLLCQYFFKNFFKNFSTRVLWCFFRHRFLRQLDYYTTTLFVCQ